MIIIPGGSANPNHPRIAWQSAVADSTVTSEQAASGFPASNLRNPATYLAWKGTTTGAQTVTFQMAEETTIDYLGIAAHNLGSAGIVYTLESSDDGVSYDTVAAASPADDGAIIHEFTAVTASFFRLSFASGSIAPQMAVVYLGEILTLERRIYVGYEPVPFAYTRDVSTGRAEQGQFLGRTTRRESLDFVIDMPNLTPAWCRSDLLPFIEQADTMPFFWAWRPDDYPAEVGYCWTMSTPKVVNQRANGMMQFSMQVQGIG